MNEIPTSQPSASRLVRGRAAVCLCAGRSSCGLCREACAYGAIEKTGLYPYVDHSECVGCGACVNACPWGDMRLAHLTDAAELTLKLRSDAPLESGIDAVLVLRGGGEGFPCRVLLVHPLKNGFFSVRVSADKSLVFTPFAGIETL